MCVVVHRTYSIVLHAGDCLTAMLVDVWRNRARSMRTCWRFGVKRRVDTPEYGSALLPMLKSHELGYARCFSLIQKTDVLSHSNACM